MYCFRSMILFFKRQIEKNIIEDTIYHVHRQLHYCTEVFADLFASV